MSNSSEALLKWEPLRGLPEQMLGTVRVEANGAHLIATAFYDDTSASPAVRIDFGVVEAFKVYEEFSTDGANGPAPMMDHAILRAVPWPFQEVINSEWVRRVIGRNGAINDRDWRHFTVVTLDVVLHVMTASPFTADLVDD